MQVLALGHTGLAVCERTARVFIDPWFAPSGAFTASWFVAGRVHVTEVGEFVDDNVLQCLGHHYRFDLETGACLNAHCAALAVEVVDDEVIRLDQAPSPATWVSER